MRLVSTASIVLAFAGCAFAQPGTGGSITSNNASFTQGDVPTSGTSTGPSADFRVGGTGNPDHLFQSWWWLRGPSDTREVTLNTASSSNWAGSVGQINYGISTIQSSRVIGFGTGGTLIETLTMVNTGSAPVTWNAFHYLDLDVGGTAGGDVATLNGPTGIRITDGPWVANYEGSGRYAVGAFASIRNELTDAGVDDFNNTGLPFAAGDWTGGFQWTFTLLPNEAITLTSSVTIIPAPASLAILGLGLAGLRRRR